MKHPENIINSVKALKAQGLSSRKIGNLLSIGKSTVNDILNREGSSVLPEVKVPRILIFDVETTPSIVATFGRWKQNIGHDNVIEEGGLFISSSWKWLGSPKVYSACWTPAEAVIRDDTRIVSELYDAFEESDIVVAHFGKGFDIPVFKTRLALLGFNNFKSVKIIDTKQIASKMKFNSNKLDSLADYFNIGRKSSTGGIKLWIDCLAGDPVALDTMQKYNEQDVVLLEQVYLQLRAFDQQSPNLANYYSDDIVRCPACGSPLVTLTGNVVRTTTSVYHELLCEDCGHRSRTRYNISSKEKRKNLLTSAQN